MEHTRPLPRCVTTAMRRAGLAVGVLGVAFAIAGCSLFASPPPPPPKPPPPPPKLSISVVAAAQLNPDLGGRSSPVVVRVYELKSPTAFNESDFMQLFNQDRSALASDIVVREEFSLRPGDTKAIDKLLSPDTQAIGVMAAFRDLDRARWRGVATMAPGKDNRVVVELNDVFIHMSQSAR